MHCALILLSPNVGGKKKKLLFCHSIAESFLKFLLRTYLSHCCLGPNGGSQIQLNWVTG